MKNRILDLLHIEYPIIQGGMAWVAEACLAAAVSEAGGLGLIAAANAESEWVRAQIQKLRTLTQKPFGVNIMLMSPYADDVAKVVVEEKVPVVTTGAGNPAKYMEAFKNAGITVVPVVPSSALAIRMERMGADAVVAEGCEAGGHIGELTTMCLVPQVVDAVSIPVIGAGGIADGRTMAAAFCLGAEGVQVGTRFLVAHECTIHDAYKDAVIGAKDVDTAVTGRSTGHPVRCIKNKNTRKVLQLEKEQAPLEEIEKLCVGGLRRATVEGDVAYGSVMAGQIAGLVKEKQSCHDIIQEMMLAFQKVMP